MFCLVAIVGIFFTGRLVDNHLRKSVLVSVVAWNVAIALGGLTGGILLENFGVGAFSWVMLVLIVIAWVISLGARKHGFIPAGK